MAKDFLGTGWSYPVETDHRGDVKLSREDDDIAEAIRIILGTAKGERIMRPEFGCDIHDQVFAAVNPTTLNMIESSVEESLVKWEPRIDVESVHAVQDEHDPDKIRIEIEYWVRSTNSLENMVYPFYTTEGDG